ncbi:hypothetical protein [Sphingomonas mucosissima]|nr:hypothetical protein [Sphingomonas mucosissima]
MSDDEAEALRIVWSRGYDAAAEAKAALEDVAGRPLDISPNFARMIIGAQEHYDLGELPGLKQNVETAEQLAWKQDVAKILQSLGLAENDVDRALAILRGVPSGAALVPDSVPLEQEPSSTSMSTPATETVMAEAPSTVPTPAPTQAPAPFPVLTPEPRPAQSPMPATASPPAAAQTAPSILNAYPEPAATLPTGTIEPVGTAEAQERTGSTAIISTLIFDTAPPAASPRIIGSESLVTPPLDAFPVAKPVETPVPAPARGTATSQIMSTSADQAYLRIAEQEGKSARRTLLALVGLPSDVTDEARICQSVFEAHQNKVSGRYVLQLHSAASTRQAVVFLDRLESVHSRKVYERLRSDGAYRAKLRSENHVVPEPDDPDVT